MDVWVTYDYDESQGKYYELKDTDVDTVKILLFPSTAFRGGGNYPHIKVYCSLLYVDTDDIPVFLYGSGKVT